MKWKEITPSLLSVVSESHSFGAIDNLHGDVQYLAYNIRDNTFIFPSHSINDILINGHSH